MLDTTNELAELSVPIAPAQSGFMEKKKTANFGEEERKVQVIEKSSPP
jgi:hypothetical protein